jgi:hypothetical protein
LGDYAFLKGYKYRLFQHRKNRQQQIKPLQFCESSQSPLPGLKRMAKKNWKIIWQKRCFPLPLPSEKLEYGKS